MVRLIAVALLACTILALACAQTHAAGGTFLWQDQVSFRGGVHSASAIATAGGRVVAVGSAQNVSGNTDFIVRAYKTSNGTLLWEDRVDDDGGTEAAAHHLRRCPMTDRRRVGPG